MYCAALFYLAVPLAEAATVPTGAVKLSKSKLSKKQGFYCGNVKKASWIPGKLVSGSYFYSHQAEKNNLAKQLKRASKKQKKKIQARIDSLDNLISTRTGQCRGSSSGGKNALRFDFSGAVGIALKPTSSSNAAQTLKMSSGSNLQKVDETGRQKPLVTSGAANISKFLIAPNDKLYALFDSPTNLADTSKSGTCLLAEVSKLTGAPSCIDDSLSSISWEENPGNAPIQFDARGAIYYVGQSSGKVVLRRNFEGDITDLINDNISLQRFLTLPDGRVVLSGSTGSTGLQWIRLVNAQGGLESLISFARAGFIGRYPDKNVYIGVLQNDGTFNVRRFLVEAGTLESKRWICRGISGLEDPANCYFNAQDFPDTWPAFNGWGGAIIAGSHTTADGKVFAISGDSGASKILMQYYPSVARPNTLVKSVTVAQGVISQLILAGQDMNGKNILSLFNTTDNSEIKLIGAENEIEIYHLNYVATNNTIMFDGLRFSDNKYVIGRYDLNTMSFSASQTGSTKLVDFQTF